MKLAKKLKGLLPFGILLIVIFFILTQTNTGSIEFCGFGADSDGKVYVGRFHTIEVYDQGKQVHSIPAPVNRGWEMTVSQDDHIIVANGSHVYTLDLDGTVIQIEDDYQSRVTNKLHRNKTVVDSQENVYELHGCLGYKWITKNGFVVYRLPLVDMITKLSFALGCILFGVGLIACKKDEG